MSESSHTLYIIAGLSRTGKSTIALELEREKKVRFIPTDEIRSAVRSVLLGQPQVNIERVSFKTTATFKRPGNEEIQTMEFERKDLSEDDYAWIAVSRLIERYDMANKFDVLIEGVAITPERVHELQLKNLKLRAAFIGYSKDSHADAILAHAAKKQDWVYKEMKKNNHGPEYVRAWMPGGIAQSAELKKKAEEFGYGYFDVTERSFGEHKKIVLDYLLKD